MGVNNDRSKTKTDNRVISPDGNDAKWAPPDDEDCYDDPPIDFPVEGIPGRWNIVMVARRSAHDHEMVHYSIEIKWGEDVAARIDTSHGTVHRHQFFENESRSGRKTDLQVIHSRQVVVDTYEESSDDLMTNAETYTRRWKYGY